MQYNAEVYEIQNAAVEMCSMLTSNMQRYYTINNVKISLFSLVWASCGLSLQEATSTRYDERIQRIETYQPFLQRLCLHLHFKIFSGMTSDAILTTCSNSWKPIDN